MSYVLKTNNDLRRKSLIPFPLKILFFIAIFLAFVYLVFPRAFSIVFTTIIKPFWSIEKNIRYGNTFIPIEDVLKENEELKIEIERQKAMYFQTSFLIKENEELKRLLNREDLYSLTLSLILKKPPFSAYDTFILDIGNNKKIRKGDTVYALGNIPIGEIVEVNMNTSKAKLYSTSGEKFDVIIGKNNIEAIATGKGGGTFEASLPHETKVEIGDSVFIPSL